MRAIRLVRFGAPVEAREVDTPEPAAGEVLVRVRAAGICHSDAHYRAGRSPTSPLPLTLGHEIAGTIERVGAGVDRIAAGDRVCVHYLVSCGACHHCSRGSEQFCERGAMLGHHRDGGWADFVLAPARSVLPLPDEIPFEHGAVLMCSSATALHAIRKARLAGGETVAIFGAGGLGLSAIQLARALGASDVYAVDIDDAKLGLAESFGAIAVHAGAGDPVKDIAARTGGRGVNVALELIGLPTTIRQAVEVLGVQGRAVIAGLASEPVSLDTYRELLGKEAELIGSNDHLMQELPLLLELARRGALDLARVVTRRVPLDAAPVNQVLDELDRFAAPPRTVIVPEL